MKENFFTILLVLCVLSYPCFAFELEELGEKLEQTGLKETLEEAVGIKLDTVTNYLNWETINVSFIADMLSTTDAMGRKVQVDSKVYKKGITDIRIDVKGSIMTQKGKRPIELVDFYMLRYPLKKEAFIALPRRGTYMKLDPEKGRKMLADLQERLDDKKAKVEKKESLGKEQMGGYLCEKVHILMTLPNGTKSDINAWLAEDLKGFPVKIVSRSTTRRGITVDNTTTFNNIEKKVPAKSLFVIPEDYIKCKNIIGLTTRGTRGKGINKREGKKK
ncbi:MAG: DUF4412 domain-containing protein [Deltaproteobacteria bacterium]|nr:DUF4412 domain-containing protein [Deltaproteobacteria bacterium]